MSQKRRPPCPQDIATLGKRIEHWRRTRTKRSPMPEDLWREASRLARIHGVGPTSRRLGVSYTTLRERLEAADGEPSQGHVVEPGFVELRATQLLGGGVAAAAVLELTGTDGRQMTVRLGQADRIDVIGLVATFLGRRS